VSPWFILVAALYVGLEWVAASALASLIGWLWVALVEVALLAIGIVVMRRAGLNAFRSLRATTVDGVTVVPAASDETMQKVAKDASDAGSLFVAGLLIAVPGLVTSAVGLLMLIPPVRRALAGAASRFLRRRAERAGLTFRSASTVGGVTVVSGDVVRDDAPPRPVRGEIISGEIVRDDDPS
jgi:UPF0716 protein FxsA